MNIKRFKILIKNKKMIRPKNNKQEKHRMIKTCVEKIMNLIKKQNLNF